MKMQIKQGFFFNICNEEFRPQYNETILSLQYCKLSREEYDIAEKWMGRLRIKLNKYDYIEFDRCLKEQFINGINDNWDFQDVENIQKTKDVTSEQVLTWAKKA